MEQGIENNENGSSTTKKNTWKKKYDIFISYRHLPRVKNNDEIVSEEEGNDNHHSSSLARSIALQYTMQGFDVYFDCGEGNKDGKGNKDKEKKYLNFLHNSKTIIVLLTEYSFEEGKGNNFRTELSDILEMLENDEKTIIWLDVDGRFQRYLELVNNNGIHKDKKRGIQTRIITEKEIERLKGDDKFQKIKKLYSQTRIEPIEYNTKVKNPNLPKIEKFPRVSFNRAKWTSGIFGGLLLVATAILGVLINKLMQPEIIIVGGGSTKNYVEKEILNGKNITSCIPGSKYIHMPSEDATTVLLDLRNDSAEASYTPIILSTGEMTLKDIEAKRAFMEGRRIFSLCVGSAQLMVQVKDYSGPFQDGETIPADVLKEWLKNPKNIIFKTSDNSGTFCQYKKNLEEDTTFKFQNVHNMRDFNQTMADGVDSIFKDGRIKIFLGNEYYYYEVDQSLRRFKVSTTMNDTTWKVPLYIYAASEYNGNPKKTTYPMSKVVYRILQQFGADTLYHKNGYNRIHADEIFISLPSTKSPRGHK